MKYKGGKLAIPAVPGAGKTFVLTKLATKLVETLEDKESLLILTYMNSSVNNFKLKIMAGLQSQGKFKYYKNLEIKTIHRLGSDLIKEYGGGIGIGENFTIISEANKYYIMSLILAEYEVEKNNDLDYFLNKKYQSGVIKNRWKRTLINITLKMISKMKNHQVTAKKIYSKSKKYRRDSLLRVVGEMYYRYDQKCKSEGILDYDDILLLTYKLLKENPDLTKNLKKKYKYIFEDEAQDSNLLQNKIINLISNGNLVKVGDPNQSILGTFTSSSPEIFKNYIRNNPKVNMFTAGRSNRDIIEIANFLVELVKTKDRLKEMKGALEYQMIKPVVEADSKSNPKTLNYGVKTIKNLGWEEEKESLLNFIKKFMAKYPNKRIGVLFPTNYKLNEVAGVLRKERVNFQMLSDIPENLWRLMNFLGDFLEYIAKPFETKKLIKLLERNFFIYAPLEIRDEISKFIKRRPLEEVIYDNKEYPMIEGKYLKKYKDALKKIKAVLELNQSSLEKTIIFIGEIFEINGEEKLFLEKISYDLKKILRYNPKWSLSDIANNLKSSINNEFSYLAKSVEEECIIEKKEKFNLTLSNYHKSKGMEWDLVYLVGVDNKAFPISLNEINFGYLYYLKKEYEYPDVFVEKEFLREFIDKQNQLTVKNYKLEKLKENIRLLYVGVTRAKEYLVLSGDVEHGMFYLEAIEKYIKKRNLQY